MATRKDQTAILPGRIKRFADSSTAFVQNDWYVAAMSDELGTGPIHRWLLGHDILLFRRTDGTPAALANRCPHRSFPMHRGRIEDDVLTCGYHGIRFSAEGRCLGVPSQSTPPKGIALRRYPLIERPPWVWIWMGTEAPGDAVPPVHDWLSDPDWVHHVGHDFIGANYIRLHEALIDLTNFSYLLNETVGTEKYAAAPFSLQSDAETVEVHRQVGDDVLPPFYESTIGPVDGTIGRETLSQFHGPGFQIAHSTIRLPDTSRRHTKIIHAITPSHHHETHYFWAVARDHALHDVAATRRQAQVARALFDRLTTTLERISHARSRETANLSQEIHLSTDQAGLEVRQILQRRADEER